MDETNPDNEWMELGWREDHIVYDRLKQIQKQNIKKGALLMTRLHILIKHRHIRSVSRYLIRLSPHRKRRRFRQISG
jgi:hypothetical protein